MNGKVIFADKHGQIVRVNPYSYILRGAKSREDYDFLANKRDELIMNHETGGFSTMSHSDSGYDEDTGYYQGHSWSVETDFWAQASNGLGEVEGTASAYWYGDAYWVNDPIDVTITITSSLKASYDNRDAAYISVPPAYTVSEQETKATLQDTFTNSTPTLHHEQGAVTFYAGEGNCFNWIQQDDRFKFKYDTGTTEYYGTYVRADVGHCWF